MLRFVLFLLVGGPVTGLFSALAVAGAPLRAGKGYFDWIHRTWSRILLRLAGVRVEADGLEHLRVGGPQVLVCNHQSLFDILALFTALPVSLRFVAKKELSRIPLFSRAMRRAGHVFIDRGDRKQAIRAMARAGERMREEGLTLGLFPEGTRSPEGRLQRFKKGAFVLAIDTQTDLVPVAVQGGAAILPKGRRRLEARPVRIRCGPRIPLEGMSHEDRDEVTRRARDAIAGMLHELRDELRAADG